MGDSTDSPSELEDNGPSRRRGRPSGKNRRPLTIEERRARNAQYERERRQESADAMMDLAEAAGCDLSISNSELLATVISQLQSANARDSSDDIQELKLINENLIQQVALLEQRLSNLNENIINQDYVDLDIHTVEKKRKKRGNKSKKYNGKRMKSAAQDL